MEYHEICFKRKLKDEKYTFENMFNPNEEEIIALLKAKKFLPIRRILKDTYLSPKVIAAFRKYYDFENNPLPICLYKYLDCFSDLVNEISLNELLDYTNYENSIIALDFFIKKLEEKKVIIDVDSSIRSKMIVNKATKDRIERLSELLMEYGIFDFVKLSKEEDEKIFIAKQKLLKALEAGVTLDIRHFPDFITFELLFYDEEIINALIDHDQLNILVNLKNFIRYEDRILKRINNHPEKYLTLQCDPYICCSPKIFKNILELGNHSLLNNCYSEKIFNPEQIEKIMIEYINQNKDVKIDKCRNYTPKLIEAVLNSHNYYNIKNLISLNGANISILELEKAIIPIIYKNDLEAIDFFQSYLPTIIQSVVFVAFYANLDKSLFDEIIECINHHDDKEYNKHIFNVLLPSIKKYLNLNEKHLVELEKNFGPRIIRYLDNTTIQNIINLDDKQFTKLLNIFKTDKYEFKDLASAYDSLKQYEFSIKCPETVNIFSNIIHAIGDNADINLYLYQLSTVMDTQFYKVFEKKYKMSNKFYKEEPFLYLTNLITKIKTSEGDEKINAINTLHYITEYYIDRKRGEYRKKYDIENDLNLSYSIDKTKVPRKTLVKYLLENNNEIIVNKKHIPILDYIYSFLEKEGIKYTDFQNALNYYLGKDVLLENATNIGYIISKIGELSSIALKYIPQDQEEKILRDLSIPTNQHKIYNVGNCGIDIYQLLSELNLNALKDTILNEKHLKEYYELITIMKKFKLHQLPSCLINILQTENIPISDNLHNVSSFISYFYKIIEKLDKTSDINITNILINAEVYSGISSVYSQILGAEDARIIKSNLGPNNATKKVSNDERLKESVDYTLKAFKRDKIAIPTFNEIIEVNSKKIRVIVGNFTHPSNFTHGERTGSCMRIGSPGESLYDFCLTNEFGFHIRFENPETGEYISRVSGFRNGNSVFLNELRHPNKKSNYDDYDLVEACEYIGRKLIDLTYTSSCPIENVFVHNSYAAENTLLPLEKFEVTNIKEGLEYFYTDIQESGLVLASTQIPHTPINLDNSNVLYYKPAREEIIESHNINELQSIINRVHIIQSTLRGENYEYVEPIYFTEGLIYGMANQDWYIYIDENFEIHEDIIPNDTRALEELNHAREKIQSYLEKFCKKPKNL